MVLKKVMQYVLLCSNSTYRKLYYSKLFDPEFYLDRYPDIGNYRINPLWHYCNTGWREDRRPSIVFDTFYYLRSYGQTEVRNEDPLSHYLDHGWREGMNPNALFDTNYYIEHYAEKIPENSNPFLHYLSSGWRMGYFPSEIFMKSEYKKKFIEIRLQGQDPLVYFLQQIDNLRNEPAAYFDAAWYHDRTPMLSEDPEELWHHYLDYGVFEGKSPLPLFDPNYYRKRNDYKDPFLVEPYQHYRKKEQTDIHKPSAWFDPKCYRATLPAGESVPDCLLEHYLHKGVFEGAYVDQRIADLPSTPVISIVVPVYNAKAHHLNNCIRSVLYQVYPHWELCLCDDGSREPHVRKLLIDWARKDARIKVTWHQSNCGISVATNSAASLATGDYIGFLDNDDELTVDCLYHIVKCLMETGADVLYTDEDLIGEDGRQFSIFYKPAYNRELLLCHNYITHFVVASRELFQLVDGCDPQMDGAQDFDLALKLTEKARMVVHVPETVYHWRASATSTSVNHDQKSYADEAGLAAVRKAFQRCGIEGEVQATDWKFYYRPVRSLSVRPHVTVILYLEDIDNETLAHVELLCRTTAYSAFDVLLVGVGAGQPAIEFCKVVQDDLPNFSFFLPDEEFSRGELLNAAAEFADGEFLLFLSSDVQPQGDKWIELLMEYGLNPAVGMTGGSVPTEYGFKAISTLPDITSASPFYYKQFLLNSSIHMNGLQWAQEVMAVDLQMCLVRKRLFQAVNGIRADLFPTLFSGADLAYRLREKGFINIYNPYCSSTLRDTAKLLDMRRNIAGWKAEQQEFQREWRSVLARGDPYYHPGCYREGGISDDDFKAWFAGE